MLDLEHADFHKTLASNRAPRKSDNHNNWQLLTAHMLRILRGANMFLMVFLVSAEAEAANCVCVMPIFIVGRPDFRSSALPVRCFCNHHALQRFVPVLTVQIHKSVSVS